MNDRDREKSDNQHTIVCISHVYNERRLGNIKRFVDHIRPLVNHLVIYDDASTDGTYEYLLEQTPHVIRGLRNDFLGEIAHRQILLTHALQLGANFVLWLDADEVLTAEAGAQLNELCSYCVTHDLDGLSLHELNLWRSGSWRRVDREYDDGWFTRLWRVTPDISYGNVEPGLHTRGVPSTVQRVERVTDSRIAVLHYGFVTEQSLAHKYVLYRAHDQNGWLLERLVDESTLATLQVPLDFFPEDLRVDDQQPVPVTREIMSAAIRQYQASRTPRLSVICLIYKSTSWLQFAYEQILHYLDMRDVEFFFVANDADPKVVCYLHDRYIPHVIFDNTEDNQKEWYINNVYRAWNHGARIARGDNLLFVNSDMAYSLDWFEHLFEKMDGHNCLTSRLVESGKMESGTYGISQDFGRTVDSFNEDGFGQFAASIGEHTVAEGGLFMPLLIRREDFWAVGGYPEGNVTADSRDLFHPTIASPGDPLISGDVVLMAKLASQGIQHQTAFDSVVYHFQCGEMDDTGTVASYLPMSPIVILDDGYFSVAGATSSWQILGEGLPNTVIITAQAGEEPFEVMAQRIVSDTYPSAKIIIQDATSITRVDATRFTIVYLHDDLRALGGVVRRQEENLRLADLIVASSAEIADAYREYEICVAPIDDESALTTWHRLLSDIHLRLASNDHFKGSSVAPLSGTKVRRHLEPWWTHARLSRELRYRLPSNTYRYLSRAYRNQKRMRFESKRRIDGLLYGVLSPSLYQRVRFTYRRMRGMRISKRR